MLINERFGHNSSLSVCPIKRYEVGFERLFRTPEAKTEEELKVIKKISGAKIEVAEY